LTVDQTNRLIRVKRDSTPKVIQKYKDAQISKFRKCLNHPQCDLSACKTQPSLFWKKVFLFSDTGLSGKWRQNTRWVYVCSCF